MSKLSVRFNLLKYSAAALLMIVPLYPKFPFIRIPLTYVSVRLEDFLIAIVGFLVIIHFVPKYRDILKNDIARSMILFLAIGLVSLISGIFLTKTVTPHIGILHYLRRIEYFIPFFLGIALFAKSAKGGEKLLEFFIKLLMIVVFVSFIYGVGQKYFSWPVIITQNEEYSKGIALRWIPGSHINSTFAGHYDLATFLVMVLPILIVYFVLLKDITAKAIIFFVLIGGLWLLTNSVSRISIVSYLGGTSLALFLGRKYKAIPFVLLVSIVFFTFSSDLLSRYGNIIDVLKRMVPRVENIFYLQDNNVFAQEKDIIPKRVGSQTPTPVPTKLFEDRSTSIRVNVEWPRALRAFSKNPILGTGYSSVTLATDNDFLRLLGEVGILGFFAFILILFRIIKTIKKTVPNFNNFDRTSLAYFAGLSGGLTGVLVNSFFIDVFEASKVAIILWLLIGILVSMAQIDRNEQIN